MFESYKNLKNIEELKYLNLRDCTNFNHIFYGCSSLRDIKPLENWNVSKGTNFSSIFDGAHH